MVPTDPQPEPDPDAVTSTEAPSPRLRRAGSFMVRVLEQLGSHPSVWDPWLFWIPHRAAMRTSARHKLGGTRRRRTLPIAGAIAGATIALGAPAAQAAGGNGQSFCSLSSTPDFQVVEGDLSTYANPGEFVSAFAPLPGAPGSGWGIQGVCMPHAFATP